MATIGKVAAVFSASTSGLKAGVSDASAQFRKLGADVATLRGRMGALAAIQGAQLFGQIAGAAGSAARSLVSMAQGEAEAIDQTSKLSRRLGMTYGQLSGLRLAGDLAGVGVETITKAATKADLAFVKASQGSKLAATAFDGVGLSVADLQGKSPAERFQQIAEAIQGLPSPADKAAATLQVFGENADAAFQQAAAGSVSAVAALRNIGIEVDQLQAKSPGERFSAIAQGISRLPTASSRAAATMQLFGKEVDSVFTQAKAGSAAAVSSLKGLGLSVEQLAGKNANERFASIADAISELPTSAQRAAAAVAIFGKSGAELLPLFEGGAGSISKAAAEAQRFGLALNAVQGQNVENMNDAFTRAFAAVQGVTRQVVAFLAPAIDGIVSSFSNMVGTIGGASIGQRIGEGILAGAESLAVVADGMIAGLGDVWSYAASVASAWRGVWQLGSMMVSFLAGVGNSLKVIFASAIVGLTAPITNLLKGVDFLAKRVGVDIGVENFLRGADAFNESLYQAMQDGGQAAGDNFAAAFSAATPPEVPPPQRGPASTLIADAIAAARAAAAAPAGIEPPQGTQGQTPPQLTASTQAVNAVDSRSSQGLAEMFRLMRGTTDDVQEQQLGVLEQIRDTLSESDPETLVSMAGA